MANPSYQNLRCKIIGKNLENGEERYFDIRDGAVFVNNKNEELDSGTIVIPHCESEIEIEAYDEIIVQGYRIKSRDMLVDSYTCTQTCFNPPIYSYEISLMSKTKLLEGMLCPSLAITRVESNPRSVWYYLNQYLNEYCTKSTINADGSFTNTLSFKASVQTKFNAIECPELQWNEPTLREVLTDLMLVADCIPVVDGNEIDYMDLSTSGVDMTNDSEIMKNINYITSSQSSSDFVSELKLSLSNTIGEDEKCSINEEVTFRNYETYMLTTENVKVETNYPIYELNSATMTCDFKIRIGVVDLINPSTIYEEVDLRLEINLMDYLLEYGEWLTKDIYYASMNNSTQPSTNYQNTCLYWKRGSKGIHNFENKVEEKVLWINNQKSVLEIILQSTANSTSAYSLAVAKFKQENPQYDDPNSYGFIQTGISSYDWKSCRFKVQYETIGNHVFLASKGGSSKNKRVVVDNQTNSYVNAKRQGILEYAKANRLGNKIKCINGRFGVRSSSPNYELYGEIDIPDCGNKYGNSIIFKKEIVYYSNYIKVNYYATENYVLKNYFTGIKSKARSWKILDGSEAFVRADNIKFYINPNTMTSISDINGYTIPIYNTLQQYFNKLNYCFVKFGKSDGVTYYPIGSEMQYKNTNYGIYLYMMEFQKVISGTSLLITFRCLDNAIVGKYVNDNNYDMGNNVKAMTQKNAKYVDENGENFGGWIYFSETYDLDNAINDTYREAYANLYPGSDGYCAGPFIMKIPFKMHKDNKEITQITIQIELNEDANDIFIGKK